ncbi:MAG: hypothetical protein Q9227_004159 [Pyrenula ochraceoflavens]
MAPPIHRLVPRAARQLLSFPKPIVLIRSPTTTSSPFGLSAARPLTTTHPLRSQLTDPPRGNKPQTPERSPPAPPSEEGTSIKDNTAPGTFLGTTKRLPEFNLVDHVVLVSGGAQGLGLTQAEALLEAGATVYALDRQPSPSPAFFDIQHRAADELGTTLHYRQVDVRDVPQLNQIVTEIGDAEGRLDGLVAAAGIQQETTSLEYTPEDANRMFEVNVTGVFMTSQAVAKQMIRFGNGGSIVLIASMSGSVANRGLICPAYNASKAAVIQLGKNFASEWGEYGIRVNTISPGYIVTAMVEKLFEKYPERRETWPKQNMLNTLSRPEHYRGAAVFLISDASSFITAADLKIDGGHSAW